MASEWSYAKARIVGTAIAAGGILAGTEFIAYNVWDLTGKDDRAARWHAAIWKGVRAGSLICAAATAAYVLMPRRVRYGVDMVPMHNLVCADYPQRMLCTVLVIYTWAGVTTYMTQCATYLQPSDASTQRIVYTTAAAGIAAYAAYIVFKCATDR